MQGPGHMESPQLQAQGHKPPAGVAVLGAHEGWWLGGYFGVSDEADQAQGGWGSSAHGGSAKLPCWVDSVPESELFISVRLVPLQ